jgi:hypothetical protein
MRASKWLGLVALLLSQSACLSILGDYEVKDTDGGVDGGPDGRKGCTGATQATDCASDERCDINYCTKACTMDSTCTASHRCSLEKCDLPVGAPCTESRWCGAGASCIDTDYNGQTTAWYCTMSCGLQSSDAGAGCPSGYGCLDSANECRRTH